MYQKYKGFNIERFDNFTYYVPALFNVGFTHIDYAREAIDAHIKQADIDYPNSYQAVSDLLSEKLGACNYGCTPNGGATVKVVYLMADTFSSDFTQSKLDKAAQCLSSNGYTVRRNPLSLNVRPVPKS
jgi:hypothetical protein